MADGGVFTPGATSPLFNDKKRSWTLHTSTLKKPRGACPRNSPTGSLLCASCLFLVTSAWSCVSPVRRVPESRVATATLPSLCPWSASLRWELFLQIKMKDHGLHFFFFADQNQRRMNSIFFWQIKIKDDGLHSFPFQSSFLIAKMLWAEKDRKESFL